MSKLTENHLETIQGACRRAAEGDYVPASLSFGNDDIREIIVDIVGNGARKKENQRNLIEIEIVDGSLYNAIFSYCAPLSEGGNITVTTNRLGRKVLSFYPAPA